MLTYIVLILAVSTVPIVSIVCQASLIVLLLLILRNFALLTIQRKLKFSISKIMDLNDKNVQLLASQYAAALQQQQQMLQAQLLQQQQQQMLQQQQQQQAQLAQSQNNETINLILSSLAAGVPTLDKDTIMSYLGVPNAPKSGKESFNAKYARLLEAIDEISRFKTLFSDWNGSFFLVFFLGRDVRPLYAGSKGAGDRLRRQILVARHLIQELKVELDRSSRWTVFFDDSVSTNFRHCIWFYLGFQHFITDRKGTHENILKRDEADTNKTFLQHFCTIL